LITDEHKWDQFENEELNQIRMMCNHLLDTNNNGIPNLIGSRRVTNQLLDSVVLELEKRDK